MPGNEISSPEKNAPIRRPNSQIRRASQMALSCPHWVKSGPHPFTKHVRFPPKADKQEKARVVRFVPKADIRIATKQHRYSITSSARVLVCRFSISTSLEAKLKDQGDEAAN